MTDTSWPQWMRHAWRRVHIEQPGTRIQADATKALSLLAQAAEVLEPFADAGNWWVNPDNTFTLNCDMAHTPWLVAQAVLSRIRAGGGDE